ncbi:MAG: SDR family NAD(P)-dependent oxidoreductase [Halioglobus sp.]|nr:SDR family NAD(P)-dependent oxidoreductase [Halioglobus sp.]
MKEFKNKTAVVTGAGSGIGRALASRCAEEGMNIAIADVQPARLESLREALATTGARVLCAELDVADAADQQAFARDCIETFGTPALLFNNAGILRVGNAWSHPGGEWERIFSINVLGVVNGINAFLPSMLDRGEPAHIINTGSVGSLVAAPGMAQYTATKMAVRGITETLAYDLAAKGAPIDVSLLCPGPVLTSISDDLLGIEPGDGSSEHLMAGQPGFITAEDCASRVFAAIAERRFWIFTHPFNDYLREKMDAIVRGEYPSYSEVVFDA